MFHIMLSGHEISKSFSTCNHSLVLKYMQGRKSVILVIQYFSRTTFQLALSLATGPLGSLFNDRPFLLISFCYHPKNYLFCKSLGLQNGIYYCLHLNSLKYLCLFGYNSIPWTSRFLCLETQNCLVIYSRKQSKRTY